MKLYGIEESPPTQRVLAILYEKDLDFEFVKVDMTAGQHKLPSYLAMNPFGQIPVFEDGDLTMFESRAINQHIAFVYEGKGTKFFSPEESKKMATLAIWMEVESQKFDPPAWKLAFEYYKSKMGRGATDEAVVAEMEEKLSKVLDVYEARLAHNKYISGDDFGLADLHHTPMVNILLNTPSKRLLHARPNVCKWAETIVARPSWAKVLEMQKNA